MLTMKIFGSAYTTEFNGIILSAEISKLAPYSFQLTDWLLDLTALGLRLTGGPGNPKLICDQPWWPRPPFDLAPKKMTRGAVFFPTPPEWRKAGRIYHMRVSYRLGSFHNLDRAHR